MKGALLLVVAVTLAACAAPSGTSTSGSPTSGPGSTATAVVAATPTPSPSSSPRPLAQGVRRLDSVDGRAVLSPDGKWLGVTASAGVGPFPFRLFDIEGRLQRTFDIPTPNWRWIEDSSGIYVGLDAPQRSASLGIVELSGGAPRDTGLQMSGELLSRDRTWIVAMHEEGCCAAIVRREIWATLRAGGPTRVVAKAKSSEEQAIAILGIDARDRLVYRDADEIFSVAVTGGAPQRLGTTAGDWRKTFIGTSSPDGTVVMVVTVDPAIWSVVTGDRATAWPSNAGEVVAMRTADRASATTPVWTADRSLLVRTATGGLAAVNVVTLEQTPLTGKLMDADTPLAYRQLKLLIARGGALMVLDVQTNTVRDTGIDVGAKLPGAHASALPGGGFLVTVESRTYRID